MSPDKPLIPQQNRSRATAQRLLSATIRLIDEAGLEAATVPKIAAIAKVAPASVYRRYADKEALIRAAFLNALEQSNQGNRRLLKSTLLKQTLEGTALQLMKVLHAQYCQHPLLLRALIHFLDTTDDHEFVCKAGAIMQANAQEVIDVLLRHRDEISHLNPENALRFALFSSMSSIETYALDPNSLWHGHSEFSQDKLLRHLAHSFVAYLKYADKKGVKGAVGAVRKKRRYNSSSTH